MKTETAITKEAIEADQRAIATAIGCDDARKVSGFEYLVIYTRILAKLGLISEENYPTALAAAQYMKANASALRQWLYETKTPAASGKDIAAKYLSLGNKQ